VFDSYADLEADIAANDAYVSRPKSLTDPRRLTGHHNFVNIRLLRSDENLWVVYSRKVHIGEIAKTPEGKYFWRCYADSVVQRRSMEALDKCTVSLAHHITNNRPHGLVRIRHRPSLPVQRT
jgi:hypothetical protein